METARAFQQDQLLLEGPELRRMDKLIGSQIERLLHVEHTGVLFQVTTDTDQSIYPLATHQIRHFLVKRLRQCARLQNIRKDQGGLHVLPHATTLLEIERNIQRIDVGIIGIIDQQAVVDALLHVETHIDRLQTSEFRDIVDTGGFQVEHHR